jgi:RHS repeat-associated protein
VGDAGDPYTGYDRFGRVENMLWWKPSTSTAAVQVGWGYDRASRRTWRRDVLADAALPAGGDQAFMYDALSQVRGRDVGRLNTNCTAIGGIPAEQETFRYDEAGNWLGYELLANGAPQIEQTRVSNRSNQLVQVDGSSAGLSYDANGNMLTVPTGDDLTGEPRRLEWDAWNRLRRVYNNGGTLMAEYEYDAQARRIVVRQAGEEARQIYYNDSWRSVEERQAVPPPPPSSSSSSSSSSGSSVPVPVAQQVWQPASRWEMLLRDRATTLGGELDQRSYPLKDVLDVVALSDAEGAVIERYSYSAFGSTTFMSASFEEQSASAYGWEFLFHAEFRDADTGWYDYGYRYYSTQLGRWLSRDPIGTKGGINIYAMVGNDAVNRGDRLGLDERSSACCTKEKVEEGKQQLIDRYNKSVKKMAEAGRPHYGSGERDSCYGINSDILGDLIPIPECWKCQLENRKTNPIKEHWYQWWGGTEYDHWVAVCQAIGKDGKPTGEEISFDNWEEDRPAGEDPKDHFRVKYPNPTGKDDDIRTSHLGCGSRTLYTY